MSGLRELLQEAATESAVHGDFADVIRRARRGRRTRLAMQATAALSAIALAVVTLAGETAPDRLKTTPPPADRTTDEPDPIVSGDVDATPFPNERPTRRPTITRPQASISPPRFAGPTVADHERSKTTYVPPMPDTDILFMRSGELHIMREDGSGVRQLTNDGGRKQEAAWSPDGSKIVLSIDAPAKFFGAAINSEIWVHDVASGTRARLMSADDGSFSSPRWSPDGRWIVLQAEFRSLTTVRVTVARMDADGSNFVELAPGTSPNWSPDGTRVVYTCDTRLCTMGVDGSGRTPIPNSEDLDYTAWSPDGQWIAAVASTERSIVVIRPDGTGLSRVGSTSAARSTPAWLSTTHIVYLLSGDGLHSVKIDDFPQRRLTTGPNDTSPAVRPRR